MTRDQGWECTSLEKEADSPLDRYSWMLECVRGSGGSDEPDAGDQVWGNISAAGEVVVEGSS